MKLLYRVYWRFYGDSTGSSTTVHAFSEDEAKGVVARQNHMLQILRAERIKEKPHVQA